jgi:predicted O-methyltransferase YrrM
VTIQPGLPRYDAVDDLPPLVRAAVEASRAAACEKACTPEAGRLLSVLAAGRARIGETGTGCGVGTAWLASGMSTGATLMTVEHDAAYAAAAAGVLGETAHVIAGDWTEIRAFAPFDLLFCDGGPDKAKPAAILELVAPGGFVVLDDLTPEEQWGQELHAAFPDGDPVRRAWSDRAGVTAVELLVTPTESALLVARR